MSLKPPEVLNTSTTEEEVVKPNWSRINLSLQPARFLTQWINVPLVPPVDKCPPLRRADTHCEVVFVCSLDSSTGTFLGRSGAESEADCEACLPGSYCPWWAQTSAGPLCPPGWFCPPGSVSGHQPGTTYITGGGGSSRLLSVNICSSETVPLTFASFHVHTFLLIPVCPFIRGRFSNLNTKGPEPINSCHVNVVRDRPPAPLDVCTVLVHFIANRRKLKLRCVCSSRRTSVSPRPHVPSWQRPAGPLQPRHVPVFIRSVVL